MQRADLRQKSGHSGHALVRAVARRGYRDVVSPRGEIDPESVLDQAKRLVVVTGDSLDDPRVECDRIHATGAAPELIPRGPSSVSEPRLKA